MVFNSYTPLTDLDHTKIKWNIRVRAQAVWKGITRETKEFRGLNMILVDDSRFRIHAFVNAKFAQVFEKDLEEGQIYNISNFIVQEYTGVEFHRCVRFEKHIYFAKYTKLQKSSDVGLQIPELCFDIFNLSDLEKMESNKRFLCDVAGIVRDNNELRDYVNDNQEAKKQKKFSITDGRCTVKVTFFDDFAERVEEAFKTESTNPIIIIIASAKVGAFQGELTLTNYPATRVYVNPDHQVVETLSLKPKEPTFYKDAPATQIEHPNMMTVSTIRGLTEIYIERNVICEVTIKRVEENLPWYDYICPKCILLQNKENERFQCKKCGKYYPWPPKRFRVCLFGCDSTGGIPIILGDREVRKLTGKTVFDITLDQAEGDEEKFPEEIKDFRGQHFKITLKITVENINKECDVCEATDIAIKGEENVATNEYERVPSPSAEDDNTIIQTQFANTQTVEQSQMTETPTIDKALKNPRIRKSPADEDKTSDKPWITKFKPIKVKKEKVIVKKDKKKISPATEKSSTKTQTKKISELEDYPEDDHIPLNNLHKRMKGKGRELKK